LQEAVRRDRTLAKGVNVIQGRVTSQPVAEAQGLEYEPLENILPIEISSDRLFGK
jgi:alanine dehydrogenase